MGDHAKYLNPSSNRGDECSGYAMGHAWPQGYKRVWMGGRVFTIH